MIFAVWLIIILFMLLFERKWWLVILKIRFKWILDRIEFREMVLRIVFIIGEYVEILSLLSIL